MKFFATCARGLESVLAQELRELHADGVEPGRGGVSFAGDLALLYRANLWLRTAIRVLMPILDAPVASTDELYEAVQSIDWRRFMTPEHTLAVDCNVRDSAITHSKFAALRVKDAICDQFLAKVGKRPSVDTETPMVGLNLHIYRDQATLSLESSGESLHKRGYRPILTKAPLNEALAAGLILLTGWRGESPLIDPMCGSGTLCIEAAWIALKRPPGLTRKRFGFMGWMNYDVGLWTSIRDEARRNVAKTLPHPILGYDVRGDAMHFAQTNARAAGIGHLLRFEKRDIAHFSPLPLGEGPGVRAEASSTSSKSGKAPPSPLTPLPEGEGNQTGILVCNPPYGERIGEEKDLVPLYKTLGKVFRERCPGWKLYVFTGNAFLARQIGLKHTHLWDLFNGKIPCRLLCYE